ncbi:phosphate acetyltransferase [Helicobacter pylori]
MLQLNKNDNFSEIGMQSLWIYPEDTEVLGVACKSLLKALTLCYQKIALFSPIRPLMGGVRIFGSAMA